MTSTRTLVPACLLLLVLALQCTSPHARSMPGDYDTQFYAPTHGGDYFPTQTDDQPAVQSDMPSFATHDTATYNYDESFASTDADDVPFDTFVDSPETVIASAPPVADEQVVFTQAQYDNDEVYFDTSNADTVYRANDGYVVNNLSCSKFSVRLSFTAVRRPSESIGLICTLCFRLIRQHPLNCT